MMNRDSDCLIYGKTESQMIAGIAICLMIWHHLFTFQNWLIDGVNVQSIFGKYIDYIVWLTGRLGNICIYIFAFQSGYSMYQRPDLYNAARKRWSRIFSFLVSYWIICISFWIIGYIFNENLPTLEMGLLNMFGLEVGFYSDWINVTFAWYVLYYIFLIAFFPVLNNIFRNHSRNIDLLAIIGCFIIIIILSFSGINEYWEPFMASIMGILASKYSLFELIDNKMKNYTDRIWTCSLILVGILLVRALILYIEHRYNLSTLIAVAASGCEGLIAFSFIYTFISLLKNINSSLISRFLCFMGEISMFLWFLHSILFTGSRIFQPYVYFSNEPFIIFLTALLIFIPVSVLFRRVHNCLKIRLYRWF